VDPSRHHTFGNFGHDDEVMSHMPLTTEVALSDDPHEPRDSFEPREWIPWDTTPLDILVTNDKVMSHMPLATEVDLSNDPCQAIARSDQLHRHNTPLATDMALSASPLGAEVEMLPDPAPLGGPGGYSGPALADLLDSILQ
jgi:hypothetical protein